MKSKNKTIQKLLNIYKEIALLGKIDAILDWDLNVNLPEKASVDRADQSSYITEKIVEKWLDPEFKALLEKAKEENDLSETDKAIMRNLTHAGKFYFQVPKEIIVEQSKTTSKAFMAWAKAKKENKFSEFAPHLEKIVELAVSFERVGIVILYDLEEVITMDWEGAVACFAGALGFECGEQRYQGANVIQIDDSAYRDAINPLIDQVLSDIGEDYPIYQNTKTNSITADKILTFFEEKWPPEP
jgi:uncharacterized protein YcgL (UPF0745 family)